MLTRIPSAAALSAGTIAVPYPITLSAHATAEGTAKSDWRWVRLPIAAARAPDAQHANGRDQGVVPARDFALSKRFYQDLGFTLAWSDDGLAYFRHGPSSFLLQNFSEPPDNFMMHLLVEDVDAWWHHVQEQGLIDKYGVTAESPADRPWGMRDFVIVDPASVLWRIAQNK